MTNSGTGKTYASAFAMREMGYKRVLFLVHRNQIARQALKSYKNVFDSRLSMGLVMGSEDDYDAEYIFATIQTVSKDDNLAKFDKKAFDCIIMDEVHHSVAGSYKKILDYFEPDLWLGMTATGNAKEFTMANTDKTAVEIEWMLDVPVREDIYEYIVEG